MSERKTCKNCGQIREGHMAFARCIGGNTQWEPITKPVVPAQSAPTPCSHEWETRVESWPGGSDTYEKCKKCGTIQDQTEQPIPPTSAPTPVELSDYDIRMIHSGLLIPNERAIHSMAREIRKWRGEANPDAI